MTQATGTRPSDFLKAIFPERDDPTPRYVRFITAIPGTFPLESCWMTVSAIHAGEKPTIDLDSRNAYFTPHTFAMPAGAAHAATKDNASTAIDCVWMESDDEDFVPWSVREAQPSLVVETSPKHYHAYWLLWKPEPREKVEAINRALAYTYLKRDRSGWDLTQLMRIPGTLNIKPNRDAFEIRVIESRSDPSKRYSLSVFKDLPVLDGAAEKDPDFPATLPKYDDVWSKYANILGLTLADALKKRSGDRSRALWRIYNECRRLGMSREEAFVLARESPNNKFKDNRYDEDAGLWRDLCGAYRIADPKSNSPVLDKIADVLLGKGSKADKREKVSEIVFQDLARQGRFYHEPATQQAYYCRDRQLIRLAEKTTSISVLMDTQYQINPATEEFKYIVNHLRDHTIARGLEVTLRSFSHYDATRHLLYVSDHDSGVWRLDGEKVDYTENGVDGDDKSGGVFFRSLPRTLAYEPKIPKEPPEQMLLDTLLFDACNFDEDVIDPASARFLLKTWVYSFFFSEIMATRPILVLEGLRGSGKSTVFKSIDWLLSGPDKNVSEMPDNPKSFKEAVRNQHHVFFDNVDSLWPGMKNLLATVATGTQDTVRRLYTDDEYATHDLRAFLGISTMEARFLRDDVADRSIVLPVRRLANSIPEVEIQRTLLKHRGELWGELLWDLNRVVGRLREADKGEPRSYKLRMADFCRILYAMCDIYGFDADGIVDFLKRRQDSAVQERDALWDTMKDWLAKPENPGQWVGAADLHLALARLAAAKGYDYAKQVHNAKALGIRLKRLAPNIESLVTIDNRNRQGRSEYRFTLK